jgi:CubicO group peptidase (beta-lactamase class C family)
LNQTIETFFPAIENAGEITIAHLLWHRSGIHNFTDDISDPDWVTKPKTEQEMMDIISKAGSDFKPDAIASYSSSNFVLLTFILESIYQQPYAKILEEKIVKPLRLKNTYFGKKIDIKDNECSSYMYVDSWEVKSEADMSIPLGAGGIVSTPADLMLFSEALFNGKLISANSLTQMKTIKGHFGMGIFRVPFYDQMGFGHNGAIDGFASLFAYFPDSNISFAYTANGLNYNGNDIAIAILSAAYNKPFEIPEFTIYDVTDEELDKYLGVYSSKQLPLKMTMTKANGKLFGQGTGQPSFPLEATEKDKFKCEPIGVVLEFNPADRTMVLKQNGGIYNFVREE